MHLKIYIILDEYVVLQWILVLYTHDVVYGSNIVLDDATKHALNNSIFIILLGKTQIAINMLVLIKVDLAFAFWWENQFGYQYKLAMGQQLEHSMQYI